MKSREVEPGCLRELDSPLLQLLLNSCFSDIAFVTLIRTTVETTITGVHTKLFCTGEVPAPLTLSLPCLPRRHSENNQ